MANKEIFTIEDARGAVLSKNGTKVVRLKVPVGVKVTDPGLAHPAQVIPGYKVVYTNESKVGQALPYIEAIKVDIDSINVAFSQAMKKHA